MMASLFTELSVKKNPGRILGGSILSAVRNLYTHQGRLWKAITFLKCNLNVNTSFRKCIAEVDLFIRTGYHLSSSFITSRARPQKNICHIFTVVKTVAQRKCICETCLSPHHFSPFFFYAHCVSHIVSPGCSLPLFMLRYDEHIRLSSSL